MPEVRRSTSLNVVLGKAEGKGITSQRANIELHHAARHFEAASVDRDETGLLAVQRLNH